MNTYTLVFFGDAWSFANEAALLARPTISAYLQRVESVRIAPEELSLQPGGSLDAMHGAITLGTHTGAKRDHSLFFIVPVTNSKLGDVYDFMPFHRFQMIGEVRVPLQFVLCNLSGSIEEISSIVTKNTAYAQVIDVLTARGIDPRVGHPNTDSTSAGAAKAAKDPTVAAVCSPNACRAYGLQQIGGILDANEVTTFGIFVAEPHPYRIEGKARTEFPLLLRNADLYTGRVPGGGKAEFVELLNGPGPLRVKWGIDPLTPSLHLGHLACLYKLQTFLDLGHEAFVVIGTFTGLIGDPSGNLTSRPRLDPETLEAHADSLRKQIECILGPGKATIEYNAGFAREFTLDRLLQWGRGIDYRLLMARTDFRERLAGERGLSLSELLYGLFQAFDTIVLNVDVELGGMDQLHNVSLMRDIMRLEERRPAFGLLIPTLAGLDGQAKMSTYSGNEVPVTAARDNVRDLLLRTPTQANVFQYMKALTDLTDAEIAEFEKAVSSKAATLEAVREVMVDKVLEKLNPTLETVLSA